jgi:hypothetical protein
VKNSSGKCRKKKKSSGILSGTVFWTQQNKFLKTGIGNLDGKDEQFEGFFGNDSLVPSHKRRTPNHVIPNVAGILSRPVGSGLRSHAKKGARPSWREHQLHSSASLKTSKLRNWRFLEEEMISAGNAIQQKEKQSPESHTIRSHSRSLGQ